MQGYRKFAMCLAYLVVCGILDWKALDVSADWAGLGALNASLATGLGVVIYGNVQEHRSRNGGGK